MSSRKTLPSIALELQRVLGFRIVTTEHVSFISLNDGSAKSYSWPKGIGTSSCFFLTLTRSGSLSLSGKPDHTRGFLPALLVTLFFRHIRCTVVLLVFLPRESSCSGLRPVCWTLLNRSFCDHSLPFFLHIAVLLHILSFVVAVLAVLTPWNDTTSLRIPVQPMPACTTLMANAAYTEHSAFPSLLSSTCQPSSSLLCPVATSMNYISSVLTSALQPTKEYFASGPDQSAPSLPEVSSSDRSETEQRQPDDQSIAERKPGTRKKSPSIKTKTEYRLAHPPPRSKRQQRLHIRPKVLLQLQQLSNGSRARPFIDVVQSVFHVSHLPARVQHNVKAAHELGADDLAIIYNEAYDGAQIQDEHLGSKSAKNKGKVPTAVATIQRSRFRQGEVVSVCIHMYDGASWVVSRLTNGTYEFTTEDGVGERSIARWVPKRRTMGRERAGSNGSREPPPSSGSFTFSIIDPNSRRHPIIANLTPSHIDISDHVSKPPPLTPSYSSQSFPESPSQDSMATSEHDESTAMTLISCSLKLFIAASGVWVALNEGFSPNFDSSHTETDIYDRSFATGSKMSDHSFESQGDSKESQTVHPQPASEICLAPNAPQRLTSVASIPISGPPETWKASHRRSLSIRTAFTQRGSVGKRATIDAHSPHLLQALDGLDLAGANGATQSPRDLHSVPGEENLQEENLPNDTGTRPQVDGTTESRRRWKRFGKRRQ